MDDDVGDDNGGDDDDDDDDMDADGNDGRMFMTPKLAKTTMSVSVLTIMLADDCEGDDDDGDKEHANNDNGGHDDRIRARVTSSSKNNSRIAAVSVCPGPLRAPAGGIQTQMPSPDGVS